MQHYQKEVKRGHWFYDKLICKGVVISVINYDVWFEMDKEFNESDEKPNLNENGEMYMIEWFDAFFTKRESWVAGELHLEETTQQAENIVQQKIKWLN
jgi:hypothetical protein